MSEALSVFAKAPIPGGVKTRLQPALSQAQSAELHQAFVQDTWEAVRRRWPGAAHFYSDINWPGYRDLVGVDRVSLQRGADLGERMFHCFEDLHLQGYNRIVIIGSDSPTLPTEYLEQAFDALGATDAVLGPTEDGGYYAVGCRVPRAGMFEGVRWSNDQTLEQTEAAFRAVSLKSVRLPWWYDVDTVDDLTRLATDALLPPHTKDWFQRHAALIERLSGSV